MPQVLFHTESVTQPLTGIGRYAQSLGGALQEHAADPTVICRPHAPATPASGNSRLPYGLRRKLRALPGAYDTAHQRSCARFRTMLGHSGTAFDLYHEPNFILRPFDGPTVVTCHDLAHVRFPDQQPRFRRRFLDRHVPHALETADRIIVPTHFISREIQSVFGTPHEKIRVIPEGVDARFHPRPAGDTRRALADLSLQPQGYVLALGTVEPRKNLATLAVAFAGLPAELRHRHPLIIAGAPGWHGQKLKALLTPLLREGTARILGYVPEPTLPALYAGASAVAYLSVYEGFGLPALEALASGTPLLTATTPALIEVTGEAALHCPAMDTNAVRESLQRLLVDTPLRRDLSERGPAHAAHLTWSRAAAATHDVYREVLGLPTAIREVAE